MMMWGITESAEVTGGRQWRESAAALYAYLRRDMRDARIQRRALYPKNHDKHVLRTVAFVQRVAREMATLYLRAPARTFVGAEAIESRIASVYRGAQVNRQLRAAHECLVATGNATVWVWPVPAVGGVRLLVPAPHDQWVEVSDPTSTHERDVTRWIVRMPVLSIDGMTQYALAEVTPTTAMWIDGPSKGRGVWREDGVNPLGQIPVVHMRGSDPGMGEWWAPVPEDLLDAQRAMIHDLTDVGQIARLQGYSQPVVKGARAEDEIEIGLETAIRVSEEGSFTFESPSPDLAGYVAQTEQYIRTVIATAGLNPASFLKSSGITALAKQIELIDRDAERQRHIIEFGRGEQRVYDIIASWVQVLRAESWPDAEVRVEYREPTLPADPLHTAQGLQIEIGLGLTSSVRERARRDGVSQDEARRRVLEDRADSAALGLTMSDDPTAAPSQMAVVGAADDAPGQEGDAETTAT